MILLTRIITGHWLLLQCHIKTSYLNVSLLIIITMVTFCLQNLTSLILRRSHLAMFIQKTWGYNVKVNIWPVLHSAWFIIVYLSLPLKGKHIIEYYTTRPDNAHTCDTHGPIKLQHLVHTNIHNSTIIRRGQRQTRTTKLRFRTTNCWFSLLNTL